MKKNYPLFVFLLLGTLFSADSVFPEVIILKSGKSVEGKVIEETDKYIKIDFMGLPLTYWRDDIESIEKSKESASPNESPAQKPDDKMVKIKIKNDAAQDVKEFISRLDSLLEDINMIMSASQAAIGSNKAKDLNEELRNILQKAVTDIRSKITEIRELNAPGNCKELQFFLIKTGNAQIEQFAGAVDTFTTVDQLSKYWTEYQQKLSELQKEYQEKRQEILDTVNPSPE